MSERGRRGREDKPVTSAIRVGPDAWEWLTAADRSGRVGGRFRGGVNAVFGSEALVSFQSPSIPIHPWALVADLAWEEVEEGAVVTVTRGELSVGRFVLPLAEAEVVDLSFHPPANVVSLEELHERIALIEQLLAEAPDPFESEFDRAFVRDRDRILVEWQETENPEVLLQLIGRGPGTTPAGDDTLIGLLAGLEVLAAVAPDRAASRLQATRYVLQAHSLRLLQATRNMLQAALPEPRTSNPGLPSLLPPATCHKPQASPPTSTLSSQLLASAAAGLFPATLLKLQLALLDREAKTSGLLRAAADARAIGETTGKAALDGISAAPLARAPAAKACPIEVTRTPEGQSQRARARDGFHCIRNE
jgi:hypothetical protein